MSKHVSGVVVKTEQKAINLLDCIEQLHASRKSVAQIAQTIGCSEIVTKILISNLSRKKKLLKSYLKYYA